MTLHCCSCPARAVSRCSIAADTLPCVLPQDSVATSAKQQNVIVQSYNIIYELIEGVRWGQSLGLRA